MQIVFNVKLRNVFRAICMDVGDLSKPEVFIKCVVEQFNIVAPNGVEFDLYNSKRAPIDFDILPIIVNQQKQDPNFYIEIQFDTPGAYIQQWENLENYLRNHNAESILYEEKRNNALSEESLEILLDRLRDFTQNEYSIHPKPDQLVEVCQAAVELFPSLDSGTNLKIEILFDRKKCSGLLYEKIRYIHRKRQGKKMQVADAASKNITDNDKDEIEQLIAFFESCVLKEQKTDLLAKLKESANLRKASYNENREFFDKCFHLYRVDSDLVLADFTFMFDVDPNSLFKKWPNIEKKPFEIHRIQLDRNRTEFHRDELLHNILSFLQLFQTKRYKFERSVSSLIVFSEDPQVDPQHLIKKKWKYPHIICIYSKTEKKSIYYMVVSEALMNIPTDFNFLQVMDLYFKIHFIFSVPFEASLAQFMGSFEKYVYGIDGDTNLTATVQLKAKSVFSTQACL